MKKKIEITEKDWNDNVYWSEWVKSINIIKWEHDFQNKVYIVDYTYSEKINNRTFESSKFN